MRAYRPKPLPGQLKLHLSAALHIHTRQPATPGNLLTSAPITSMASDPLISLSSDPLISLSSDPVISQASEPATLLDTDQNMLSSLYIFLESNGRIPEDRSESSLKNLPAGLIAALQPFSTFHPMTTNHKGVTPTQS